MGLVRRMPEQRFWQSEGEGMEVMLRKMISCFVCACLFFSTAACSGSNLKKSAEGSAGLQPDTVSAEGKEGSSQPEPLLDADATDGELLEALGDEVHVVTDEDYIKMVKEFQEHTEAYAGQIYQLEGAFATQNGAPCIARTVVDGNEKTTSSMPLKYLTQELEEGTWIRVTGIVNEGEIEGKSMPLLEAIVVETP